MHISGHAYAHFYLTACMHEHVSMYIHIYFLFLSVYLHIHMCISICSIYCKLTCGGAKESPLHFQYLTCAQLMFLIMHVYTCG